MGRCYSLASQLEAIANNSCQSLDEGLVFVFKTNNVIGRITFYLSDRSGIQWEGNWSEFFRYLGFNFDNGYESFFKACGVKPSNLHPLGNSHTKEEKKLFLKLISETYDNKRIKCKKKFISEEKANEKGYSMLDSEFYGELEFAKQEDCTIFKGRVFLTSDMVTIVGDDYSERMVCGFTFYRGDLFLYDGIFYTKRHILYDYKDSTGTKHILEKTIKEKYPNAVFCNNYYYDKKYFLEKVGKYSDVLKKYYIGTGEIEGSDCLQSYHTNHTNPVVRAKGGNMFFGIELERSVEVTSADYVQLAKDGWRCEQDGSVAAEYISPVLSLDNIEESIDFIKATAQPILDGSISDRCGGHIHVSVPGVDYNVLYRKAVVFMPLLWAIYPRRASNSYSNRPSVGYNAYENSSRSDIRKKPSIGTIEFRIFPGCKGEDMVRFRLSLLNIIMTKALSFEDEPTFKDALDFILSSKEMFDVLSKVYNTSKRMKDVSERIANCYKSVEGIDETIDISGNLVTAMEEFVANKVKSEDGREYSI